MQRYIGFQPSEISALINEAVVQQHAEDSAFLWLLRNKAVSAPHYKLTDLEDLDERVEANIDGLRMAGDYGWKISEEQLEYEEPGEVFVAGVLAFESGNDARVSTLLEIGCRSDELVKAMISSLGWIAIESAELLIQNLCISDQAEHRKIGIGAYAVNRNDPGELLRGLIHDADTMVRARALKAAGELGRIDLIQDVMQYSSDTDLDCRFFSAWSAARLGMHNEENISVLGDFVVMDSDHSEQALQMILRCMSIEDRRSFFEKRIASPDHQRLAVIGAGIIGDPALIPEIINFMSQDNIARVAGESFSMITGADLEYLDLDQDAPEGVPVGPTEDVEDEEVDLDPDEDLPWPNPKLIQQWWLDNQKNFKPGHRYLGGKAVDAQNLQDILRFGNQRERMAAALEQGIGKPEEALFEVRAPGKRQLKMLNR